MEDRLLAIREFIEKNFAICKVVKRSKDTLLTIKCPVCEDNKKPNNKNRVRASFKITGEYIGYKCLNCDRGYWISSSITSLAYLLSREKEISFAEAKQKCAELVRYYAGFEERQSTATQVNRTFEEIELPGERIHSRDHLGWLVDRGFDDPKILRDFREEGSCIIIPFTLGGKVIGYQEIDIWKRQYKNHSAPNDLTSVVIGLDDITPATQRLMVVESVIDAKLITQDSESIVVGLAISGLSFNEDRIKILTEIGLPFIINFDNDRSGIKAIKYLSERQPLWRGTFTPSPYKDYGEYRKAAGPMAALSKLVSESSSIYSSKFHLLRVQ